MIRKIRNFPYYARKAYREGLGWAYAPGQNWLRRAAQKPLAQTQRWTARLSEKPAPCAWRLSGLSNAGNESIRVVLLGDLPGGQKPSIDYYETLLFQKGTVVRENLGPFQSSLRQQAERLAGQADLLLVAGDPNNLWRPPEGNWRLGPASLRLVVNLPPRVRWDDFLHQLKPDPLINQLRDSGWSSYISHRRDDFFRFYRQIYRPTLESSPAEFVQPLAEADVTAMYEQHPLVMLIENAAAGGILANEEPLAGALSFPWHGAIHTWLTGVWHGNRALIEQGALAACDYFGLKWAIESGYAQYEAGPCLPFQSDPGYKQKRIWGVETVRDPWQTAGLLAWAPPLSFSGLSWLHANSFQPGVGHSGGSELSVEADRPRPRPTRRALIPHTSAAEASPRTRTPAYRFEAFSNMDEATRRIIRHGLRDHAIDALGAEINKVHQSFAISVQDEKGQVIGGLLGSITWNFLHIDTLWVSPKHRGHDLGTRLMKIAETTARAEGLEFITLETASFEAINFYPRFGYEIVGQVNGIPPGHTLYYLKKAL